MCGIAGIFDFQSRPVDNNTVLSMIDSLAHRGPDGQGVYLDGFVGLGHRRLSIFDLSSAGAQPMISPDGNYVITFNGEVYNWPEIRKNLSNKNWRSQTDSETILHAYIEHGKSCLKLFNGMFAFAIWDKQNQSMFLARDRIGIKPLYYSFNSNRFYFASEIKALFAANFPRRPNNDIISDFLQWGLIDHSDQTFFEGIKCLNPGHYMEVDSTGNKTLNRYWDLFEIVKDRREIASFEAIETYKDLLEDSIKLRVRSDVPVGVFLSGGVDSSILAAQLVKNKTVEGLEAYTYDFETGDAGEAEYASEVAQWLGIQQRISKLGSHEVPDLFNKVLFNEEMPITSLRVIAAHKLYEEYAPSGSTVVLEGHGGDHVGAGFEYYLMAHLMDIIMREGTNAAYDSMLKYMDIYNIKENERLKKLFNFVGAISRVGSSTQDGISFINRRCFSKDFISEEIPHRVNFPRPFNSHLLNSQYIDLFFHNLPRVLRYADRGSMAVGRETRVPILDHRIVEFSFCTSEQARVFENQQRFFMRKASEDLLPKEILSRPKRSIVDPQRSWLKCELKSWITDIFSSKSFSERGIFDQKEVLKEYKNFCNQERPLTSFHIFQYLNLELWFRELIDF